MKNYATYSQRARKLEKGTVATMTTTNLLQKARHALDPMRKATMDAFLLGTLIVIVFTYAGTVFLFTFPLLLILVYALVYAIAVVLRLRQAATNSPAALSEKQASPIDNTAYTLVKGWSRETTRTPPEVY